MSDDATHEALLENPQQAASEAAAALAKATGIESHDLAMVLGSGWAQAADLLGETVASVAAHEIPGFRKPALDGHVGTLRTVRVERENGSPAHLLVIGARTHLYEGHGVRAVVHGVRTAAAAGCRTIVLTNGCGGVLPENPPGSVVLINDHINLQATSPLEGATFIDLTDLYSERLRAVARSVDPDLPEGVYVGFRGPHFETPAEVRMARSMGGHLVGMSTVLEAIAAREARMEVLGMSLVTNLAAGVSPVPLSHQEVLDMGREAAPRISRLLADVTRAVLEA